MPNMQGSRPGGKKVKGRNVKVDRCPACKGIWFDGKELEMVLKIAANKIKIPADNFNPLSLGPGVYFKMNPPNLFEDSHVAIV